MVQVDLPAELRSPQHAVQLETGRYVITQHDSVNCVCIVDSEGQIQAHYQGSRPCRDRRPGGLAISRRDKYVPRALAESREVWAGGTPTFQEICISANPKFNFFLGVRIPRQTRVYGARERRLVSSVFVYLLYPHFQKPGFVTDQ